MWSDEEVDDLLNELQADDKEEYQFGEKKSRSAKTGRRARGKESASAPAPDPDPVADDATAEDLTATEETKPTGGPPKPSRRVSGWGAESSAGRRRGQDDGPDDDERLRPQTTLQDSDSDNEPDIPVIPELEDTQEDDLTTQVAVAPTAIVNRVATYRELDSDLMRHAAFLTLDNDIDLKLLSKGLSAEADVQEEDIPWDWDRLFTEVTSELLTEWERTEQAEEEEKTVS